MHADEGHPDRKPGTRLSNLGHPTRKPIGGPTELTPRMRLLIDYMVNGLPRAMPGWPDLVPGEPLTVEQAADVLRIRRRNARDLLKQPLFERELAKATQALRTGAHPRAVRKMVDLIDEPGAGKAADRKVQLAAAQAVLGEEGKGGTSVSVTVNNQVAVAGYVIRIPERQRAARTIDAKPSEP